MTQYTDQTYKSNDGLNLHYRDYSGPSSDAPVIITIPGLSRNANDFNEIADHLSKRFRVISFELRGRGESDWDPEPENYTPTVYMEDIIGLLSHLGLSQVIFFGTSLGGLITMALSTIQPDLIRAAILNDIGGKLETTGIERIQRSMLGDETRAPIKNWPDAITMLKFFLQEHVYPNNSEADWETLAHKTYKENSIGIPVLNYDPAIGQNFQKPDTASGTDMWHLFDGLKDTPTLVLRGGISDFLSHETIREMTRRNPNCVAQTVAGVGHAPALTESDAVSAIDSFLDSFA